MFPAKFIALVVGFWLSVFHLQSAVSTNDATMPAPISCANCTICQYPCHPPPVSDSPTYEIPSPPPPPLPPSEPEPLPVPVAPVNCPPTIVQCCQFPPPPPNANIYTPFYNESSSSFLKLGLFSAMAPVLGFAAIF